ncbi:RHGB_ASPAC Rhamnogalacturonase B [Morchella conica CCBAS932]|uniref:rhamnogalacturonan endolyase n=2 Tax=Morchella sect. Distantes TaxID=1051054 RepID=A0A3N4KN58_9PEZI|nr:RHGB_ASPAC Rhamnogalacturonase B [Morchella conica CCBAS932]
MKLALPLAVLLTHAATSVLGAFQLTSTSSAYTVDTDGGLVFSVSRTTGDILTLVYNSVDYQSKEGKWTHINSGLGTSTVTAATVGSDYIKITIVSAANPVTQYYVAKKGDSVIYMGTYITGEVSPGELRWLARLDKTNLPTSIRDPASDNTGGVAIEGSDVFLADGTTRCKFYSSDRFIDDLVHTVSGPGVYISLVMPGTAYETSSGGPFMRDINNQETSTQQEFTFYMNSGHLRTETWRMGLKGPYAAVFSSTGPASGTLDTSFFSGLDILGYVPQSGRGRVTGTASGVPSGFEAVIAWSNTENQYWTRASTSGSYTSPYMKPGTYTMKLYKQELLVATQTVTVTVGGSTTSNIASTEVVAASPVFRIGEFDGQPFEFKNGDKFLGMHPSDTRMSAWGGNYTVGVSTAADFPMALFAKTGGPATIKFMATSTAKRTLRIATTLSFKTGRPSVVINGAWTGADPGAPVLIDSRGVTRGGYRGYGESYEWDVPAGTLVVGENTLVVGVTGSGDAGFLSANYIVDAIELY